MRSPVILSLVALSLVVCGANIALSRQYSVPPGSPRIGFDPIAWGNPFHSSAALSYLTGRPVVQLPGGVVIDPNNTGVGITLSDPAAQQAAMQARYQVASAQQAQAYQQAMDMQQKAMDQANSQRTNRTAVRPQYNTRTGARRTQGSGKQAQTQPLFNDAGQVNWPEYAPNTPARADVDQAIQAVRDEVKQNGSASVATTVKAKQALRAYGYPAIKAVPGGSKLLAERLRTQLNQIDLALDQAAGASETGK